MAVNAPATFYRTDPDGKTIKALEGIHIANTVSCSADGGTMYLADSTLRTMWTFPIGPDGSLGERTEFANTEGQTGAPDGSAVDAEGYLWNAQWGALADRPLRPRRADRSHRHLPGSPGLQLRLWRSRT